MNELLENLSHSMRGAALMFYILMCIRTFPERNENNFKKILFWSMVMLCVLISKDMLFLVKSMWTNEYFCNLSMLADLLYVPVMALFFFEAVSPGWIKPYKVAGFFLPSVSALILYAAIPSGTIVRISMVYTVLFGITVITVILLAMSRRDNRIKSYFSDISDISVTWVWKALCTLLASLLAWTALMWKSTYIGDALYFIVSICCWSYIYCLAVKHKVVEIPAMAEPVEESGAEGPVDSQAQDTGTGESGCAGTHEKTLHNGIEEKLTQCMSATELFLQPRLTLSDLAGAIGTNRTYLSDFLNKRLDTTFYEYINGFRARKAAELILSNPEKTLTEIAELSGYNSMSTFYRSFTRTIGMPPSKFKARETGR